MIVERSTADVRDLGTVVAARAPVVAEEAWRTRPRSARRALAHEAAR
jgi:hypothetical protein